VERHLEASVAAAEAARAVLVASPTSTAWTDWRAALEQARHAADLAATVLAEWNAGGPTYEPPPGRRSAGTWQRLGT